MQQSTRKKNEKVQRIRYMSKFEMCVNSINPMPSLLKLENKLCDHYCNKGYFFELHEPHGAKFKITG